MQVTNATQAREYVHAWTTEPSSMHRRAGVGPRLSNAARFRRLASDMRTCAGLTREENTEQRQGYLDAAEVLDEAAAKIEQYHYLKEE